MSAKTIGIVLLLDVEMAEYVRRLAASEVGNKIDFTSCHPHLSLFHLVTDGRGVRKTKRFVDQISARSMALDCYEINRQANGWGFLEVRKSRALGRLQRAILPVAEFRTEATPFSWRADATIGQKRAHTKYGYPNVGAAWSPHFTFAAVTDVCEAPTHVPSDAVAIAHTIAIGIIGKYGMLTEIIHEKNL